MLLENKKKQRNLVSEFLSKKYDDDIVEDFLEKISNVDKKFCEGKLSSPMDKEVFAAVEAKLFVDHICTIILSFDERNNDEGSDRFYILHTLRDNTILFEKLYAYYLYAHAVLVKKYAPDKDDGELKILDRKEFSWVLDILMSYMLLK